MTRLPAGLRPRLSGALALCALLLLPACWGPDVNREDAEARRAAQATAVEGAELREPPSPAQAALSAEIGRIGRDFDGEVGIAVEEIATGWATAYNGDQLFPQQSVSKLWVALAVLDRVDRRRLDLDREVTIRREDLTLFHQPIRALVLRDGAYRTDLADLLERALTRSDNTANDVLLREAGGPTAVRRLLARKDLSGIRFGPGERKLQSAIAGLDWKQRYALERNFYDARDEVPLGVREAALDGYLAEPVDGATPVAIAYALAELGRGELLSDSSTRLMLDILERTRSGPRRLKGAVPPEWSIAHKTGTGQELGQWQTGYNDVGIVTSPDGRAYAVAVMIRKTSRPVPERMAMMQEVVRAVVEYHNAEADDGEEA